MPLYQQIILTIPKYTNEALVTLFKKHTKLILKSGGTVRAIEHNGIRPLQREDQEEVCNEDGERYFWEARYVSSFFDASPQTLTEVGRMLKNEEGYFVFIRFGVIRQNRDCAERIGATNIGTQVSPNCPFE